MAKNSHARKLLQRWAASPSLYDRRYRDTVDVRLLSPRGFRAVVRSR